MSAQNEKSPLETQNLAFLGLLPFRVLEKECYQNRKLTGCIAKLVNLSDSAETTLGRERAIFVRIVSVFSISSGLFF